MKQLKWRPAYSVSIPEIDQEHKDAIRIVVELQHATAGEAPPARLRTLLHELLAQVGLHFEHEERLMRSTHYPAYAWHKRQHDAAAELVAEFAKRIGEGRTEETREVTAYVAKWLVDHICFSDRMMSAHLRNYTLAQAS